ncbi:MAG TPA: PadR family transcriptional regulator [Candidatus Acidoferrum sp.]|nr:PadR family transcriptional regulator [Candidatus Acidoferrum sp.]
MKTISMLGYAILGLLHQQARSGYDLRKIFANTPMGTFSDSPGAIYPALQRLEKQGLLRGQLHPSSGRRRRRVFRATASGKRSFKTWQTKSISADDIIHRLDELMLRFGFMDETAGPAHSVRFLRSLTRELRRYTPSLRQFLKANGPQMPLSGRLALESGVRDYEELLRWSRSALAKYVTKKKGGRRA